MDIKGRAVIVTGAGSDGCGRAIAIRFAGEGAAVVVDDVDEAGARETLRRIEADGGRGMIAGCDVRTDDGARELIELTGRSYGAPAVVVNNASHPYHPDDPLEHWREIIETDLLGPVCLTRRAIGAMRAGGRGGAIVNMCSISALPFGGIKTSSVPAYDAAKAGMMHLTTNLAALAATDNIRVNCLVPGWMASKGPRTYWESLTPEERLARRVPSRLLSLDEVADVVVRLATDETLFGRAVVWQSEDVPRLIAVGDAGHEAFEDFDRR